MPARRQRAAGFSPRGIAKPSTQLHHEQSNRLGGGLLKRWNPHVGLFWLEAAATLVALALFGSVFHVSIWPARLDPCGTLAMVPAILWSLRICIRAGGQIDILTRASLGLAQIVIILAVFADLWGWPVRMDDPWGAFRDWVIISVVYTIVFAAVTQALSQKSRLAPFVKRTACLHCGYSLRGLTTPRCPECGQPFDRALLQIEPDEPRGVKRDGSA